VSNLSSMGVAFSGLQAAQAGMLITSQNVSGSAVEGFSRRRVEVVMSQYSLDSRDLSSTAFAVDGFSRDYSSLLEKQRGRQQGLMSELETKANGTSTLDTVVLDAASSVGTALDKFFAAAGALARDPGSVSFKAQLFSTARQLAERFNGVYDTVKAMRESAEYGIKESLANANRLASQLASINQKVAESASVGSLVPSPDLLDRRDQLLIDLQRELGGQAVIGENGMANLYVNGNPMVDLNGAARLSYQAGKVYLALGNKPELTGTTLNIDGNASGRVKGYYALLTDFVPELETRVGEMAKSVADTVNSKLGSNGIQPAPDNKIFTYLENESSGLVTNFRLREDLDTTASTITQTEAKAIESIRLDADSPISDWATFTTYVGGQVASWKADYAAAQTVSERLDLDRERMSGVNLDEEAANLMRFQQMYGAASKVLQIGSQLFDQLLNALR